MSQPMLKELKAHVPFTMAGALTGIVLLLAILLMKVQTEKLEPAFEGLHAVHVFLSAIVTTAMYRRYRKAVLPAILIGFFGSVGIASLSDIIFPHHGGALILKLTKEHGHMHFHLPAIEEWWLINPVALLGVAVGMWKPMTKIPHSGHVLLSTWASLFYLVANAPGDVRWAPLVPLVFVVLFVAVWIPCCFSDIMFPLLFVRGSDAPHAHEHARSQEAETH